jgi:ADP-dependent NAD(P)H-hydrate dehydratase / NAD(P)H-hydrate epimerase
MTEPLTAYAEPLPSSSEMMKMDAATIASGVPSLTLMERAGQAVCDELIALVDPSTTASLLILCGCGNNGGDGLVVARLAPAHWNIAVVIATGNSSQDFEHQLERLKDCKRASLSLFRVGTGNEEKTSSIREIVEEVFREINPTPTIVLDAMLGTGQKDAPRGSIATVLGWLESLRWERWRIAHWISIDAPTGINANTGEAMPGAFRADKTISIELTKRGLTQYPARVHAGEVIRTPIGIDPKFSPPEFYGITADSLRWDALAPNTHKGDRGQVFITAGSRSMPGAAALCALGALSTGVGTVCKLHHPSLNAVRVPPEVMLVPCGMREGVFVAPNDKEVIAERIAKADALALGPGLGTQKHSEELLLMILKIWQTLPRASRPKLIIDADGLTILANWISQNTWQLLSCQSDELVLTPHPKEASRLISQTVEEIQKDRFSACQKLAQITGATVLLKGAGTIVHNGINGIVIGDGGPELAIGGSGDVLTGCIASLMANGYSPFEAAVRGACLHGRAGARASQQGTIAITASMLATYLGSRSRLLPPKS